MNAEINKELIFKHFAGRATAIQKQMIEEWVTEPAHLEQYFLWLQEWEQHNWQYAPDVEKGMERHWNRINNPEYDGREPGIDHCSEEGEIAQPNLFKKIYWLVAASFLITLWAGGWVFRDRIRYETFTTGYGETQRIDLADGSKVVLNSNSTLSVPRFGFGRQTREVLLNGEADFDIRHTSDNQRFIVKTYKRLEVEVLGTEFNVYARPRGTKVVLNKGKVQLHYQEGESLRQLTMKPGDLVTMDSHGRANLQKTENPRKFSAWKAHRFVFEKTSLREVCYLFEDNFGVRVQIPDTTLAELTISGSFTALNAEELLGILTEDSGLNYEKSEDGKTIVLSY